MLALPPSNLGVVRKLNHPNKETPARDQAPAPVDSDLDSEKRRKDFFEIFLKAQTQSSKIRDRRKYVATLRTRYAKNHAITLAVFDEWLQDYEAEHKAFEAFRDRWLYQRIFILTDDKSRVTYVQSIEKTKDGDIIARLSDDESTIKITERSIDDLESFLSLHTNPSLAPHIKQSKIDYVDRIAAEARAKDRPTLAIPIAEALNRPALSHSERISCKG